MKIHENLQEVVDQCIYKRGWRCWVDITENELGESVTLHIVSDTEDSYSPPGELFRIRVHHQFLVPLATYNKDVWAAWLFDRFLDVEKHEAGEFFMLNGVRAFGPHHGNGEDPYRIWFVSDYAKTRTRAGDDNA